MECSKQKPGQIADNDETYSEQYGKKFDRFNRIYPMETDNSQ